MKSIKTIILGFLVLVGIGYAVFTIVMPKEEEVVNPYENSAITVNTFEEESGFGYDVLIDGNIYVHQPNIPAVGGNKGFKTEADARATGNLAVQKINEGIIPPTISVEELREIGVVQ
jgi:hypothetical protein